MVGMSDLRAVRVGSMSPTRLRAAEEVAELKIKGERRMEPGMIDDDDDDDDDALSRSPRLFSVVSLPLSLCLCS